MRGGWVSKSKRHRREKRKSLIKQKKQSKETVKTRVDSDVIGPKSLKNQITEESNH